MRTRTLSAAAVLGFALATTICPRTARADSPDEVDLIDGAVLRGHVAQQVPGSYVVIRTEDGRVQSIPWSQVRRVDASGAAPAPAPAAVPESDAAPAPVPAPVPSPASADRAERASPEAPPPHVEMHLELGLRAGYAFASGDYAPGVPLGSPSADLATPGIGGGFPLTLDAGTRIAKYVYVGGFASYAFLSTNCPQPDQGFNSQCDAHDVTVGLDVQLHPMPRGKVDPWIGVGIAHEWLTVRFAVTDAGSSSSATEQQTLEGWNFADLMLGLDVHVTKGFGIGPYLEMTSGSFGSISATTSRGGSSQAQSSDFSNTSAHQWFTLGTRGTFEVL